MSYIQLKNEQYLENIRNIFNIYELSMNNILGRYDNIQILY
jgi:hypothetical protein